MLLICAAAVRLARPGMTAHVRAAVSDMNATTAASRPCYSGMYGTCHQCDYAGSCICGKWTSGHSDMITMDQTRWGGIVYVCATFDVLITIIWAVNMFLACIISRMSVSTCKTHFQKALKQSRQPLRNRSVHVLGLLSASSFSILGLSVAKVASASYLIGIDLLPSLLFSMYNLFNVFSLALHTIHLIEGALSTQESTLGRTRIRDEVRREARYTLLVCAFCSPLVAAPMLGAFAEAAGQPSETLQQIQFLLFNGSGLLAIVLLLLRIRFGSRRIIESIAQSILALKVCAGRIGVFMALAYVELFLTTIVRRTAEMSRACVMQASLAIAGGGVSAVAEQARDAYGTTGDAQYRPAHLKIIDRELEQLEAMQRSVRAKLKKLLVGGTLVALLSIISSCVPYVWNRFSHIYALNVAVAQIAYAYPVVASYVPAKQRAPIEPAARPAAAPNTEMMHIQSI